MIKKLFCVLFFCISWPIQASYRDLAPGIRYGNFQFTKPSAQSIHILTVDPCKATISLGVAQDKCAAAEKTSVIAKRNNAIAAINGGFFDFGTQNSLKNKLIIFFDCLGYSSYNAYPIYTLKAHNHFFSLSSIYTGALAWNHDHSPVFTALKTRCVLNMNAAEYPVSSFNMPQAHEPRLYAHTFDKKTPFHRNKSPEIIIKDNCIYKIYRSSHGKNSIPENGFAYVIPNNQAHIIQKLQQNDPVSISFEHEYLENYCTAEQSNVCKTAQTMVASTPLLVYNNDIAAYLYDLKSEFYTDRHPRTAVGATKHGTWICVVVDGRQKHAAGFTILELAQFMKQIGCTGALNLDGGGSSTMVIEGSVVNSPSGRSHCLVKKERPVSNALLIHSK